MLPIKTQELILTLQEKDVPIREMMRLLKISRNSIRRVLRQKAVVVTGVEKKVKNPQIEPLLPDLYQRTEGNVVRIQEILAKEHQTEVSYSTLTRQVRQLELRPTPKRAGEYYFAPGEEMQHDTSPHKILMRDKKITLQCASLVFAFSRKLFIKYYSRFTRFEAKAFLTEAIQFMDGACKYCIVDNTSVILAGGSGASAQIAPEMATLLGFYGSEFKAHAIGHADRKAHVERNFYFVEKNFLPGRSFESIVDLNQQARHWCIEAANQKIKRVLGMSPEAAYIQEKPYLLALPTILPPIYNLYHRIVDTHGYLNIESQRYSAPQKFIGKLLDVYQYESSIEIYYQNTKIASHPRLVGQKGQTSKLGGHHENLYSRKNQAMPCQAETTLRCNMDSTAINQYIDQIKKRARGKGQYPLQKLLQLKRTYPKDAFEKAIIQALQYGLYDIHRLESIILKYVAGEFFNLPKEHFDDD